MGNKCTKFQVDWTSSKTTLTKNFNLKRMDEQMNGGTDQKT